MSKYKCSIIQTEQNTTDVDKIQIEQNAKEQNTNCQNTNVTKNKCNKMQMEQNTYAKMPKYKHDKIQNTISPGLWLHSLKN